MHRAISTVLLAAVLLPATAPAEASAQARRSPSAADLPLVVEVGAGAGIEFTHDKFALSGHLRIPIDPWNRVALAPHAWVEFLDDLTEYQLDADAVVTVDGTGTFYVGGGAAFRNTVYGGIGDPREFRTGYNLIAGLRTPHRAGQRGFQTRLEYRRTSVAQFDLNLVTLSVTYPLLFF